jgi:TM2 domain-containing membrane protein YozV
MYKFIGADGQQYGPVSAEQIRRWMSEGRVGAFTRMQTEGSPDWKACRDFPEFAPDIQPPPLSSTPPPPQGRPYDPVIAAKASNKIAAGILGILLGSLGIHKFVLGYNKAGLIMLLVSVLSCGFAAFPIHIIGIIEGVMYLTKTDEEFVRTYVDQQREWF